jgi:hypothetical protein
MKRINFEVDDADYEAIMDAIAEYERTSRANFNELILPDGDGDVEGRIIAERMRGFRDCMAALDGASAREEAAADLLVACEAAIKKHQLSVDMEWPGAMERGVFARLKAAVAKVKGGPP